MSRKGLVSIPIDSMLREGGDMTARTLSALSAGFLLVLSVASAQTPESRETDQFRPGTDPDSTRSEPALRLFREVAGEQCVPFENDPLAPLNLTPTPPMSPLGIKLSLQAVAPPKPDQGLLDQLDDDLGRIRDTLFDNCKCAGGVTIRCNDDLGGFGARCQGCTITMSKAWCASLGIADGTVTSPTDEMFQFKPVFTPGGTSFVDVVDRKCALLHETYHSCQTPANGCSDEGQAYTATTACYAKFLDKYCWTTPPVAGGNPSQKDCDDVLSNFWSFITARGFMQCMCDPNVGGATQGQKCDTCVQQCKNARPNDATTCDTMKKQYCSKPKLTAPILPME
jgi:hypothetical protein